MIKNKRLWSLFAFTFLASCTVGPDYKQPRLYENEQIAASLELSGGVRPVNKDWYRRFHDPLLDRLVAQSLKSSPDVKVGIQKLRQARDSLKIAAVGNLPMINADGSYHYNKPSKNIGYTIDTDYYQTGLDASWELDIWGSGRRQTESAAALFQAAAAGLDNVYLSITAEVAADYIGLRTSQAALDIAESNLKLQSDIFDLIKVKYDNGLVDTIAYNQAKYAVETTKALIPDLQSSIEAYKNALAILTGKLPGALNAELDGIDKNLVKRRFNYDLNQLYELPVNVVRCRPDVKVAEMQLISQNAQIGKALAELFPNISLSGFLGFQSTKFSNLVGHDSYMYTYTPTITLPILHWGQLLNNVELQKNITKEYYYTYQKAVLNAASEIKNAMVSLSKEYDKNQASRGSVIAQKQIMTLTWDKYQQGLVDFSDVLTAERDLLASQNALIASNGQIYQDIIAFYKSVGGGYESKSLRENINSPFLTDDNPCRQKQCLKTAKNLPD